MDRSCSQELRSGSLDVFYSRVHVCIQSPCSWQVPRFRSRFLSHSPSPWPAVKSWVTMTPDSVVSFFWRGVSASQCLHGYFICLCCQVIMLQTVTAGETNLRHLGRDADGSRVSSLRKSFPPRTCPLQVQLENASLAALLAETAAILGICVLIFSFPPRI